MYIYILYIYNLRASFFVNKVDHCTTGNVGCEVDRFIKKQPLGLTKAPQSSCHVPPREYLEIQSTQIWCLPVAKEDQGGGVLEGDIMIETQ